eukprot:CAMPEP_0115845176 /NCGR_PEP_ID=MMETSP0287-20121206/9217_1 /TAXON_ID=412157 /ORGANISM="Chrysochromulina rotalis, Strain UIO044" /LENGTH=85 /DNA_ID=CAMNT_0003298941 /DNA_START=95 /DNA_END=352 /DNA_ORIENTATION=-
MAAQPATASPRPGGHTSRSVQMASISTLGEKSQSAAAACSKQMHGFSTDGQRQHQQRISALLCCWRPLPASKGLRITLACIVEAY